MRDRWDNRFAFIMAAIGSAIGLGNVWRFPYIVAQNGGGAFIIPFLIALITAGIPLMILEMYIGMKMQTGPGLAWAKIKNWAGFVGWFALLVSFVITTYYAVVMGWTWNFIWHSITVAWKGDPQGFFLNNFLNISEGPGTLGGISLPIMAGVLLTWAAIYFCIFKGVKLVGKVVNFTVTIPFILLILLFIRGITLNGWAQGLNFYLISDFSALRSPAVWIAAYGQVFFSLSLGFGIMIAYASYMPEKSDTSGSAIITSLADAATSFFAGYVIFSTMGYMALTCCQPVADIAGSGGPGLAFIAFPQAISCLPGGPIAQAIIGIMFFITLLTLGIDSAFSLVEAVVTGLDDRIKIKRELIVFIVCALGALGGLLFSTRAGLYWLDIVDHWMNSFGLVVVGFLETIIFAWFYRKLKQARSEINEYSSINIGKWWEICLGVITPCALGVMIFLNFINELSNPYEGYPWWTLIVGGWGLIAVLFLLSLWLGFTEKVPKDKNTKKVLWLILTIFGIIAFLVTFHLLYETGVIHTEFHESAIIMTIVGAVILFGGLIWALNRSHHHHQNPPSSGQQ